MYNLFQFVDLAVYKTTMSTLRVLGCNKYINYQNVLQVVSEMPIFIGKERYVTHKKTDDAEEFRKSLLTIVNKDSL